MEENSKASAPEEFFREFRPAWKSFGVYFFGVLIFVVGPIINPEAAISPALSQLIATLLVAFIILTRFGNLYQVTQLAVIVRKSYPKFRQEELAIRDIRRVDLRRGISQRLLGVAHVYLYVEGKDTPAMKLFGVPRPEELRRLLLSRGAGEERVVGAWRR